MSEDVPIGIIELGDVKIKCIIFKINNNNETEILSTALMPSEGIQNDVIVNLSKASNSIRSCIGTTEKKAKISLKKINVVFEQPNFLCTKFSKSKRIDGSKIHKDDIEFLLKEAKKQLILNDKNQSIIHIFNHNYIVDGKTFMEEPIDVFADSLTHEITFITVPKNNLKNIRQAFTDCDIEVERFISRVFALGVEKLSNDELQIGSALIDLGYEKISLGLFKKLALVHSITFPIGTNHIHKDISKVCALTFSESENIIKNVDFTFQNNKKLFDENDYLKSIYFTNSSFRKISKNLIENVIKARLDEIINILNNQIKLANFTSNTLMSFALEGNSNLINIKKYFTNFFGFNFKKYEKQTFNGNYDSSENFSACLGGIKIIKDGWETEAIPENGKKFPEKVGFFAKIFKIN